MPRKKPFSNKQKKKQLQDKRRRKQDEHFGDDGEEEATVVQSHNETGAQCQAVAEHNVKRVNQQPGNQRGKKTDPNRYRLHFHQEDSLQIERKKKLSRQPVAILPEESLEDDSSLQYDPVAMLDIPKRPHWDYSLSKQQLENNEEKYFKGYLDKLFDGPGAGELSYFELNLETWRQLWRVIEMSDVFLLIVDIRHPSLHFPPALYHHLTAELQKPIILVLNKVDLAPPPLVVAWQHFFQERFPLVNVVCFTSFPKDEEELEAVGSDAGKVVHKGRKRGKFQALGPRELFDVCHSLVKSQVDLSSWATKIEEDQTGSWEPDTERQEVTVAMDNDLDLSFHQHEKFKDGVLTIGCVGYPNVGKSSVMNGLMGKKVVSVSRTPGHTKHFQTIYLTPSVRLCDCPGLVFPSFIDRNLQILAGIYPVAQVREPCYALGYLAQRLDLPRLLGLKHPCADADNSHPPWSAVDICDAWAEKRGFLTAKAARHDTYRAANHLLRMAVTGRLCLCLVPPGYTKSKEFWLTHPDTARLRDLQVRYRTKPKPRSDQESDSEDTSSEEESNQGRELSDSQEESEGEENQPSFSSSNPFALLSDD